LGPPRTAHSDSELSVTADEITCQQFVELVTEYFEGALEPHTLTRAEEHLVMCDWCVTYAEQMQSTVASLGRLGAGRSPEPPESALAVLRERSPDGA